MKLLGDAIEDALEGRLVTFVPEAPSRLWFPANDLAVRLERRG